MNKNTKAPPHILATFSRLTLAILLIALLFGLQPPGVVRAATITFTFDSSDNNKSVITKTADGVTITLSNCTCNGVSRNFTTDIDGIFLRRTSGSPTNCVSAGNGCDAFDISFDSAVTLQSYEIGFVGTGTFGTFDLTATSGNSLNNPLIPTGPYPFNSTPSLTAGETASVATTSDLGLSQIKTIWVGSPPTAITLRGFSATATASGVEVAWQTTSEVDTRGFNVWRSQKAVGGYEQLNAEAIPALDPGGWSRNSYHYVDGTVLPGRTYYYRLEVIALDGSADWAGPVSVSSRFRVYLPTIYGSRP